MIDCGPMGGTSIIVCGRRHDIEHPVVTFEDDGGFSAYVPHCTDDISKIVAHDPAPGLAGRSLRYRKRRTMGRSTLLRHLKHVVSQVVVHLDGCRDARMCYNVLHNQRGLSIHFMVDNDGTIYQTLDLLHCAFHAGGVNEISVGIELQNRGDAARYPDYYPGGRERVTCRVHGAQFLCYDFTRAQYEAMVRLSRALIRIFDIPATCPLRGGDPVWSTITAIRGYRGFLGHYHVADSKWDPGPFDFLRLFRSMGSRATFPLTAVERRSGAAKERLRDRAAPYFDNAEKDAPARFPVGPLGQSRLWHGGVHLVALEEAPVYAALEGQLVAAQLTPGCPVGSCNFVLLRHRFAFGQGMLTFFTLYYHLGWVAETSAARDDVPWLRAAGSQRWLRTLARGEVAFPGITVEAGEPIGTVGVAGPAGDRAAQIHFAVFSARELGRVVDPGHWKVIDGTAGGRFCHDRYVLERIDRPMGGKAPDGLLSRRELRNFFRLDRRREELRRVVVRHLSEWTPEGWTRDLEQAPDFAALHPVRRRRLVAQQVKPTTWWTPEVGRRVGLPQDGVVYSYNPIEFLAWFDRLARGRGAARSLGIEGADKWEGKHAPRHLTVDVESAAEMTDVEDYHSGEQSRKLTLEDLVRGYGDES